MVIVDTGQVADLVFVIEGTANMGAYLGELKANYIVPTLECFNGGPAEDKECGSELTSTLYALIVFMAADAAPEPSVTCGAAPTTSISKFLSWLDRVPFLGGAAEGCSHIVEGLGTALQAFDDFQSLREPHLTTQKHCILVCNSPPYPLPCLESNSYVGLHADQLASLMGERGINLSIISPRKIPALFKLYDKAGGDLQLAQNKNYTKDRRHLVLLKGYQLQERPLSPASAELKDKPQLAVAPQIGSTLQPDKSLLTSSSLTSAGSPAPNILIQPQPKVPVVNSQIGKKRPPGGSPPNQPPFKQPVTMQQGNLMNQVGPGPPTLPQSQQSLQGAPLMGPQPSSLAPTQPPMSTVQSSMPNSHPSMHLSVTHQKQNQVRSPASLPVGPISHPVLPPQAAPPPFMNQPNPPNVTITRGPPVPVITTPSISSPMCRPIRDPAPMNPGGISSRMTWNPPSGPGGMPPQNAGPNPSPVSQLVMRLQQPVKPGLIIGPRPSAVDAMNTRPPIVTAPGAMNSVGPGGVIGMIPSNIGPGGQNPLNQSVNMPPNVGPGGQNLPSHLNMVHPPMSNPPSALQNQLGSQGQRLLLLQPGNALQHIAPTSVTGNQPQMSSGQPITSMAPSGQPQSIVHSALGNMVQPTLPGVMNQPNSLSAVPGQGPMPPQQVNQPPSQPQAPPPGQQLQPTGQKERRVVWQGIVEWQEKPKMTNDPMGKINRQVQCQVSSSLNNMGEPEVNADKWPKKLIMQLIPKVLMQHFGSAFLKMSRNVIFHFNNNMETVEALGNLNKVMSNGFIGCVHFSPHQNANCDIRILMLIYSNDKHTYVGFIPNDQSGFVAAIRNVITKKQQSVKQQQAAALQQHMFGPQGNPGSQQMGQMNPGLGPNMTLSLSGSASAGGPGPAPHSVGGAPVSNASGGPASIPTSVPGQVGPANSSSVQGVTGMGGINSVAMQQAQQPGLMVSLSNPGSTATGPPVAGPPGSGSGGTAGGASQPGSGGSGSQVQAGSLEAQMLAAERQQNLLKIQQLQQSLEAAQQKDMRLKAAQEHQKQQVVHNVRQPPDVFLHVGGNTSSANNPQLRHLLQIRQQQQLMLQQQGPGQRPQMPPGQMGQPGMGPGPQQPPNPGGNLFGDDIM